MKVSSGFGEHTMEAAYAPTSRASCKGCGEKIEKGTLRLTNILDAFDHYLSQKHYHAECFKLEKVFQQATYKDIYHVEDLTKEDQIQVQQILEKLKSKGDKKVKTQKQNKQNIKVQQDDSNDFQNINDKISQIILEENPKKKGKKINSTGTKKIKKNNDSDDDQDYNPNAIKEEKQITKLNRGQSDSSEEDNEINKEPEYFCLYDEKQKKLFRQYEKELSSKQIPFLKQQLKNNDQKCTGTKPELIQRICDCKVLGCPQRCPHCSAGRPKLIQQRKVFKCPGYMDDTEFRHCNKILQPNEITRIDWRND